MRALRYVTTLLAIVGALLIAVPAHAQIADPDLSPLIDALAPGNFKDREAAIGVLVATGDPRIVPVLEQLALGELYFDEASGKVVFTAAAGGKGAISDPVTGAEITTLTEDGL